MDPTSPLATEIPESPAAPPLRRRRRWLWITAAVLGGLLLLVALAPMAVGLPPVRRLIESKIAENLRGTVAIGDLRWSWLSGVTLAGLEIGNPPGFPSERPALRLRRANVSGMLAVLLGSGRVAVELEGLEVFVEQDADAKTNLEQLAKLPPASGPDAPADEPGTRDEPTAKGVPPDVELTFDMRDCLVEIRRNGELLERLADLEMHAATAPGDSRLHAEGGAKLLAGEVSFAADLDPTTQSLDGKLSAHGLDLERWQPVVAAFVPNQVQALAGKVEGDVQFTTGADGTLQLGGELVVDQPRIAGPLVSDMDVRSATWRFTPVLTMGRDGSQVDASRFAVDLGWFRMNGKPAADGGLAFGYSLDVAALAEFGGPMPAQLKGSGARLDGELALRAGEQPQDVAGWMAAIVANAVLQVPQLAVAGVDLRAIGVDLEVAGSRCEVRTKETTLLEGGPLLLTVGVDLRDLAMLPTTASLRWNGGKLTGPVAQGLRYVMPLLAGIDENVASIVGECDLELRLGGPAMKAGEQTWLGWLDQWTGDGALGLKNAGFAPAPQLQGLLAPLGPLSSQALPLGENGRLTIDLFRAPFSFADGVVRTTASEWLAKGQKIGLAGSVGLDGALDYTLDLTALLQGHKDGRKVLQALGGALPKTNLKGTLTAPSLALPELGDVAQKLLEQQGKDLLKKGIQDLFKR